MGFLSDVFLSILILMIFGRCLIVMSAAELTMYCFLLNETSQWHTYILLNIQVSSNCLGDLANSRWLFMQELRNGGTMSTCFKEREEKVTGYDILNE